MSKSDEKSRVGKRREMFKCQTVGNMGCDEMGVEYLCVFLRVQGQERVREGGRVTVSVRTDNGSKETLKIGRERELG